MNRLKSITQPMRRPDSKEVPVGISETRITTVVDIDEIPSRALYGNRGGFPSEAQTCNPPINWVTWRTLTPWNAELAMRLDSVKRIQDDYLAHLAGRHGETTRLASSTIDGLLATVISELDFRPDNLKRVRDLFVRM